LLTPIPLLDQARSLGADKLARLALEKLACFRVPPAWQEQLDLFALSVRARPFADAPELMPTCFRCQTSNPLLNQSGDRCVACGHAFVRSFASFEILPLVRFAPGYRSTPEEVLALIRREPPPRKPKAEPVVSPWASDEGPDVQRLALGGDVERLEQDGVLDLDDPFTKAMLDFEPSADFTPPVATPEMLLGMDRSDVFIIQWPHPALGKEYYRNMLPDVPVVLCTACNHFFHEEDWEFAVMQKGACPFCQSAVDAAYGNGSVASMVSHEQADKAAAAAAAGATAMAEQQ
jgi:intraflagellar transport protein 122